jgi:hypothetical protein
VSRKLKSDNGYELADRGFFSRSDQPANASLSLQPQGASLVRVSRDSTGINAVSGPQPAPKPAPHRTRYLDHQAAVGWVIDELRRRGATVRLWPRRSSHTGVVDLVAGKARVAVKVASSRLRRWHVTDRNGIRRVYMYPCYSWNLHVHGKPIHDQIDAVVLVSECRSVVYVCPVWTVPGHVVQLPARPVRREYNGRLATYRNAWSVLGATRRPA